MAAAATSLHAAWLTMWLVYMRYQQVAHRMAIARRRLYSANYAASEQVVKSCKANLSFCHFELGPHCQLPRPQPFSRQWNSLNSIHFASKCCSIQRDCLL